MIHELITELTVFVGLDQKTCHTVTAGSVHCVCLTGKTLHGIHGVYVIFSLLATDLNSNPVNNPKMCDAFKGFTFSCPYLNGL